MTEDITLEKLQSAEQLERRITVIRQQIVRDENNLETTKEFTEEVLVRPMVFAQWLKGLKSLKAVMTSLPEMELNVNDLSSVGTFIVFALAECQDEVIELASLTCNRPASFFETLALDDAIKLFTAVFEVNKDFFIGKILPMFKELVPATQAVSLQTTLTE